MDDKLTIRINLADRYYPLKIPRKDEEKIRKAAKMINEKILMYKQKYSDKDVQDFLAMAALQYVVKVIDFEEMSDISPILVEVQDLNREMEEYLENE